MKPLQRSDLENLYAQSLPEQIAESLARLYNGQRRSILTALARKFPRYAHRVEDLLQAGVEKILADPFSAPRVTRKNPQLAVTLVVGRLIWNGERPGKHHGPIKIRDDEIAHRWYGQKPNGRRTRSRRVDY